MLEGACKDEWFIENREHLQFSVNYRQCGEDRIKSVRFQTFDQVIGDVFMDDKPEIWIATGKHG